MLNKGRLLLLRYADLRMNANETRKYDILSFFFHLNAPGSNLCPAHGDGIKYPLMHCIYLNISQKL